MNYVAHIYITSDITLVNLKLELEARFESCVELPKLGTVKQVIIVRDLDDDDVSSSEGARGHG